MASSESRNNKVIQNAFSRFLKNEESVTREGMCVLAKAGLDYLIDAHDFHAQLMMHTTENDTMGYAVAHNGTIVASGSHNGGDFDLPGSAKEEAEALLSSTTGWVAIILSDMEGWYRVDYEEDFLFYAADEIRENFHTFFKPIAR